MYAKMRYWMFEQTEAFAALPTWIISASISTFLKMVNQKSGTPFAFSSTTETKQYFTQTDETLPIRLQVSQRHKHNWRLNCATCKIHQQGKFRISAHILLHLVKDLRYFLWHLYCITTVICCLLLYFFLSHRKILTSEAAQVIDDIVKSSRLFKKII